MTNLEATQVVVMLVEAFPTPAWTKQQIQLFARMIEDLDADVAQQAAVEWIQIGEERPTIAAIRRFAARHAAAAQGGGYLEPDEAWGFVDECFARVGRYQPFPGTHPLVKHAVDSIGWTRICEAHNVEVVRAQFRQVYAALLKRSTEKIQTTKGAKQLPPLERPGAKVFELADYREDVTGPLGTATPARSGGASARPDPE
jgi:hypothetical protein